MSTVVDATMLGTQLLPLCYRTTTGLHVAIAAVSWSGPSPSINAARVAPKKVTIQWRAHGANQSWNYEEFRAAIVLMVRSIPQTWETLRFGG
jgi:hypothetical protein